MNYYPVWRTFVSRFRCHGFSVLHLPFISNDPFHSVHPFLVSLGVLLGLEQYSVSRYETRLY